MTTKSQDEKPLVYVTGQISDLLCENDRLKFTSVKSLLKENYEIVTPFDLIFPETPWAQGMLLRLETLEKCKMLFLIEGWSKDRDAKMEEVFAAGSNIKIVPLPEQLWKIYMLQKEHWKIPLYQKN